MCFYNKLKNCLEWKHIWTLLFLFPSFGLLCQLPTDTIFKDQNAFRDSISITKIHSDLTITSESDIEIKVEDLFYDKAMIPGSGYGTLQHTGSPQISILREPIYDIGVRLTPSLFPAYDYTLSQIATYLTNIPYSEVNYAQALSQDQHSVDAFFARELEKSTFMIQYNRKSDIGFIQNQANLLNNLYSVLTSSIGRVDLKFTYISNVYNTLGSGGILNNPNIPSPFIIPTTKISSQLSSGKARNIEKIYSIEDIWSLNKNKKLNLSALHHLQFIQESQRYYNTNPDDNYFGLLNVDKRGFRFQNKISTISNKLGLKLNNSVNSAFAYKGNAGVLVKNHFISQGGIKTLENWLAIDAQVVMRLRKSMDLSISYTQSIIPNLGDLVFKSEIKGKIKDLIEIEGHLDFINQRPALSHQYAIASGRVLWSNNFRNSSTLRLGGDIGNPYTGLKAGISYSIIDDYIYFGTDRQPRQVDHTIQGIQFTGSWDKNIRFLTFKANAAYQAFSYTEIEMPDYYAEAIVTAHFPIFKERLHITSGPYIRYLNRPIGQRFEPIINSYVYSELPQYQTGKYSLNYLFSFRIESFNLYVHAENLQLIWDQPYSEIAFYPEYFVKWRLGIKWKLLN